MPGGDAPPSSPPGAGRNVYISNNRVEGERAKGACTRCKNQSDGLARGWAEAWRRLLLGLLQTDRRVDADSGRSRVWNPARPTRNFRYVYNLVITGGRHKPAKGEYFGKSGSDASPASFMPQWAQRTPYCGALSPRRDAAGKPAVCKSMQISWRRGNLLIPG